MDPAHLRHLRYLRLVVDHGTFSAAGRAAGVSQPAISHAMRVLERALGTPLFELRGRNKVPTEAALRAALHTADAERHLGRVAGAGRPGGPLRPAAARDLLRAGLTASAALLYGAALHRTWCAGHPARRLDLSTADEGALFGGLQGGELDLIVAPLPRGRAPAGLAKHWLYMSTPVVFGRRGHPLARAALLPELAGASWAIVGPSVSGPVDVLREAHAVRRLAAPRIEVSCPDYAALVQVVAQSDLLCVLPHPVLLAGAPLRALAPVALREAMPRYDEFVFTRVRPGAALVPVIAALRALGEANLLAG